MEECRGQSDENLQHQLAEGTTSWSVRMTAPRREKKDTFKEWRKSIAHSHVPINQIGPDQRDQAYRKGWNRIFGEKKQFEFDLKETKK